jgi:hypothetical protein
MPVDFVSGDICDNAHHAQAFAQGCRCQDSMGAGIAKTFRKRYPEMFDEYRSRCKAQPLRQVRGTNRMVLPGVWVTADQRRAQVSCLNVRAG